MASPEDRAPDVPANPRQRAARLFAEGLSRAQVARVLGVSRSTSGQWFRVWQEEGSAALETPRPRGRKPKLEDQDLEGVRRLLLHSPRRAGFDLDTWSLDAIVAVIHRQTGVAYHPRHVARVLRRLGWVVAPVGKSAPHAFVQSAHRDPDGNEFFLRQRWVSE